jgi:hypothetical protein
MITAIVTFALPTIITLEQAQIIFSKFAPQFENQPGLIRKHFLLSKDGTIAGGIYLWQSQASAEHFYNDRFKQAILREFGSEPSISYFKIPITVENQDKAIA